MRRIVQMALCACLFADILSAQTPDKVDFARDVQPIFQQPACLPRLCRRPQHITIHSNIWTLSISDPEHKAALFLGTDADEAQARFSPDGRYIIYRSDESGTQEIYLRTFPDTGGKWQVSKGGGASPRWSRDGKEIYFTSGSNTMAVKVSTSPTVQLADAVKLFTGYDGGSYDVAPDGRFLMGLTSGQNSVNPITVTLHWQSALKK